MGSSQSVSVDQVEKYQVRDQVRDQVEKYVGELVVPARNALVERSLNNESLKKLATVVLFLLSTPYEDGAVNDYAFQSIRGGWDNNIDPTEFKFNEKDGSLTSENFTRKDLPSLEDAPLRTKNIEKIKINFPTFIESITLLLMAVGSVIAHEKKKSKRRSPRSLGELKSEYYLPSLFKRQPQDQQIKEWLDEYEIETTVNSICKYWSQNGIHEGTLRQFSFFEYHTFLETKKPNPITYRDAVLNTLEIRGFTPQGSQEGLFSVVPQDPSTILAKNRTDKKYVNISVLNLYDFSSSESDPKVKAAEEFFSQWQQDIVRAEEDLGHMWAGERQRYNAVLRDAMEEYYGSSWQNF